MKILRTSVSVDSFFQQIGTATRSILMLDYDGTLSPFTPDRDQAYPYDGIEDRLSQLIELDNVRVIIVSGRAIADLKPLLRLSTYPELWGSHGLERLHPNGRYTTASQRAGPSEGLAAVYWWAREQDLLTNSERKLLGIAFHWRGLSAARQDSIARQITQRWSGNLGQFGLELHTFDGGIEVRCAGVSKADAVRAILTDEDESHLVAYLGDDHTDEDAFVALVDRGLRVLVRSSLRDTAADVWIKPPGELLAFLDSWILAARR